MKDFLESCSIKIDIQRLLDFLLFICLLELRIFIFVILILNNQIVLKLNSYIAYCTWLIFNASSTILTICTI